jgi:hypothetical protein
MRLIAVACAVLSAASYLIGPAQPAMSAEVEPVKLGLDFLSPDKENWLKLQILILAEFEFSLENCGFYPDMERRATAAVRDCVKPESLAPLVSLFRESKQFYSNLAKTGKVPLESCSSEKHKIWLRTVKKDIEDQIKELARMCRACIICRN